MVGRRIATRQYAYGVAGEEVPLPPLYTNKLCTSEDAQKYGCGIKTDYKTYKDNELVAEQDLYDAVPAPEPDVYYYLPIEVRTYNCYANIVFNGTGIDSGESNQVGFSISETKEGYSSYHSATLYLNQNEKGFTLKLTTRPRNGTVQIKLLGDNGTGVEIRNEDLSHIDAVSDLNMLILICDDPFDRKSGQFLLSCGAYTNLSFDHNIRVDLNVSIGSSEVPSYW